MECNESSNSFSGGVALEDPRKTQLRSEVSQVVPVTHTSASCELYLLLERPNVHFALRNQRHAGV
jgi:hypothetical protein